MSQLSEAHGMESPQKDSDKLLQDVTGHILAHYTSYVIIRDTLHSSR